ADVIKECIVGAIEARYGKPDEKAEHKAESPLANTVKLNGNGNGHSINGNGHSINGNGHSQLAGGMHGADDKEIMDCCADGTVEIASGATTSACTPKAADEPRNFEEFIYKVWGSGIARHFAIPYNKKLWAVPLTEMETSWLGGRVPLPNLEEIIDGALHPVPKPMGPNARFGYPLRGGFQALMDGFLPLIGDQIRLNTRIVDISLRDHSVTLDDGSRLGYEYLISTMPLPALVRMVGDEAPDAVREAVQGLRHVSVRCVNLGIGRANLTEKHWIYYPEDTVFHRIFVQGNASPHCNPAGGFGLTCEITYSEYKPLPCEGQALIQRCIEDCHKVGIFTAEDEVWVANEIDMPYAYVVYDHARAANVNIIRDWLLEHDVVLSGRYSEWEYYNSDHAFVAGKQAADEVARLRQSRERTLEVGA
nr:FAD-dependent oxidoreductase [Herpetosiphonaceae bacterium]